MKAVYKSVIVVDLCVRELQIVLSSHRDIMLEHVCGTNCTCHSAEHEKWRDDIYPAYSTLAHMRF